MSATLVFLVVLVAMVGLGALILLDRLRRRPHHMPVEEKAYVHIKWHELEALAKRAGPSNLKQAVIEADKLVDHTLKHLGARGETMGDRMRSFQPRFTDYDGLWKAHKTRNQVVHETRKELLASEANASLRRFKQALTDLGVL